MRDNCIFCKKPLMGNFGPARACSIDLNHSFYIEKTGYEELAVHYGGNRNNIIFNNDFNRLYGYDNVVRINVFSILENKSVDELIQLYNKINVFK